MTVALSLICATAVAVGLTLLSDEAKWQIRGLAMAIARCAAKRLPNERSRAEELTNWPGYVAFICDEERRHLKALVEALELLVVGQRRIRLDGDRVVKKGMMRSWAESREIERRAFGGELSYFRNIRAHRKRGESFKDFRQHMWDAIYEQLKEDEGCPK